MSANANQMSENIQELNLIEEIMHHASKNAVAKLNNRGLDYLPLNPKKERRNIVVFEPKMENLNQKDFVIFEGSICSVQINENGEKYLDTFVGMRIYPKNWEKVTYLF